MNNTIKTVLLRSAIAAIPLFALVTPTFAVDQAGKGEAPASSGKAGAGGDWVPPLKPAKPSPEQSIAKFKIPSDLQVKLWAAEPMLGDPNAICTDEHGRVYVAETYRYHGGVLDIRAIMGWLDEDLACKTVADRVAMTKRHVKEPGGKEALGVHDSERIVLLEDTTGSGVANKSTVFATGFNRVEDGLGSGILARHGDVYYTCIPSLYLLKDTNGDGKADVRKALQTGYGIRWGFLGHDLHGLVFGPDGKLYFSIGDRAANVEQTPDGRHVENLDSGSVFRCDPDGTNLEIFAVGLRNPQELRFDQFGNLFTGDNNPDKGDPARWVYVVEDGDSGWRVGYQHATRMANGGPWMAEQLWSPEPNNNADYLVPCISAMGAGPSGLAYYPGTGLPDRYQNHFFLCDFRGGAQGSLIHCIENKMHGATFEIAENKPFIEHILCTDCEFAVDGGLYVGDWVEGWNRPMAGRIYKVFDPAKLDDKLTLDTKKIIGEGMDKRTPQELAKLIAHPDMRVRQEAQFALAAAGADQVLLGIAQHGEGGGSGGGGVQPRLHAIWGLGQIARKTPAVVGPLVALLNDKDLDVRCQAAKVLGDAKFAGAYEGLLQLLKDPEPRARFFAAGALGKLKKKQAVPALFAALKENNEQDAVLRYGLVTALAKIKDTLAIAAAAKDESPAVRMGACLAMRRLEDPAIGELLADKDPQIVLEAARAINDIPIEGALPDLAAMVNKPLPSGLDKAPKPLASGPKTTGTPKEWVLWRAVNANYRLGTPEAAKNLATFAARDDAPAAVRIEALKDLGEWEKPSGRDHVTSLWRALAPRDAQVARTAAARVVGQIAKNAPNNVRIAATNLMQQLGLGDPGALAATVQDTKASPDVRVAALQTLAAMKDPHLAHAVDAALKDKSEGVRCAAIAYAANLPGGVQRLEGLLNAGSIREKQAALTGLGSAGGDQSAAADATLGAWLDKLSAGQVPPELRLDLLDAAAQRHDAAIASKVKAYDAKRDPKDPLSPYRECEAGGDAALGHKIFRERADVSCIRCHTAMGEGGIVGPRLDGIGGRQTREYLLESIVNPNAKIAPGFESVVVQTTDGKFHVGIVKQDDAKQLVLLNPDAEPAQQLVTIPKDQVKTRERGPSAMPEGLVKTLSKQDLRNLVEFLASMKEQPKDLTPAASGAAR